MLGKRLLLIMQQIAKKGNEWIMKQIHPKFSLEEHAIGLLKTHYVRDASCCRRLESAYKGAQSSYSSLMAELADKKKSVKLLWLRVGWQQFQKERKTSINSQWPTAVKREHKASQMAGVCQMARVSLQWTAKLLRLITAELAVKGESKAPVNTNGWLCCGKHFRGSS